MEKLLQDLDKYLDWLETPNENFGGRPVCPFLAPDRKNGKLKIEIYNPKVKTIWEHILIFDREDYNTALFLHVDDSIREVTRAKMADIYTTRYERYWFESFKTYLFFTLGRLHCRHY